VKATATSVPFSQTKLFNLCKQAGADDVGFVELARDALVELRNDVLQALPRARSFIVFVRRVYRHAEARRDC
jgi:hypothetical protein